MTQSRSPCDSDSTDDDRPEISPIFIVGAPRSGTTLLRSMIDAHPGICCPPWETGVFDRLSRFVTGDFEKTRGKEANFCPLPRDEVLAWMRETVDRLMRQLVTSSGKPRWGEKTPSHVFHIPLIREVYPDAQFIHIIRDGRDVVKSLQNVDWNPAGIRWSVNRWIESVQAGRRARSLVGDDAYFEVRYDQLIQSPEATAHQICDFIGEPFEPQMLQFNKPENNSWGISGSGVKSQSINKSSYRDLSLAERLLFRWRAGSLMSELGYW